uniref:LIM zinc-binding domain-containing protein n=1 Tax=Glossina palpalis gambiensis TaxID=67801 RepID=A0A1B0BQI8_9MUSC
NHVYDLSSASTKVLLNSLFFKLKNHLNQPIPTLMMSKVFQTEKSNSEIFTYSSINLLITLLGPSVAIGRVMTPSARKCLKFLQKIDYYAIFVVFLGSNRLKNNMMTMDITKTEPNVGSNNLQNSHNNNANSGNTNSITSAANNNNNNGSQLCAGCGKHIQDRYLLKALDMLWHEDCLKCGCCDCRLGEVGSTLYTKGNLMLCKRDYLRLFGNTGYCAACSKVIPAFEMVMRARTNVYHLECFACQQCNHRFCVGDRFYLCENKILCEYDYEERLVFASMANHPMLKRHANSIGQDSANAGGAAGAANAGMLGASNAVGPGPRAPGDLNNNGPQAGANNSPFGAGAGSHMKNSLGASS